MLRRITFLQIKILSKQKAYEEGFLVKQLFLKSVLGFQTHRDHFAVDFQKNETRNKILELKSKDISDELLYKKYLIKDNRDWKLTEQRRKLQIDENWERNFVECSYRPFDNRSCYLSYVTMDYPRKEILDHVAKQRKLLSPKFKATSS